MQSSKGKQESRIEVRPVAIDIEKIKNAPVLEAADLRRKYPQFDKIVLMASRLEKEKNIQLAINSWPGVLKEFPKAGLVIVGSGSCEKDLRSCALRLAPSNVIIESWADFGTLVSYYKTADVFLNTSLFEGYGMTLVEAQVAGCRIVSTDVGVAKEVGARIVGWDEKEVAEAIIQSLKA